MSFKILKYFEFRQGEILLGMSVISSLLEYCRMTTQNLMEKLKHSRSYDDILQRSINLKEWKFKAQLEVGIIAIFQTYNPIIRTYCPKIKQIIPQYPVISAMTTKKLYFYRNKIDNARLATDNLLIKNNTLCH